MNNNMKKYAAGGFVFVVFQWLAYTAFTGGNLTERTRGSVKGVEDMMLWLIERIGTVPATAVISILGVVLGFYAYKRMERLSNR